MSLQEYGCYRYQETGELDWLETSLRIAGCGGVIRGSQENG
jgi:hypothetical protein